MQIGRFSYRHTPTGRIISFRIDAPERGEYHPVRALNAVGKWALYGWILPDGGILHRGHWQDAVLDDALRRAALSPQFAQMGYEGYASRTGRCARCGKRLTDPESVARGIGPECAKQVL